MAPNPNPNGSKIIAPRFTEDQYKELGLRAATMAQTLNPGYKATFNHIVHSTEFVLVWVLVVEVGGTGAKLERIVFPASAPVISGV